LVAKEFVASRTDQDGVLVLSSFTGAAREFREDALIINPYDIEESAKSIYQALSMPREERKRRMERMQKTVSSHNIYAWAADLLNEVNRIVERRSRLDIQGGNESARLLSNR
ncbi:MAG: trehalose-6-phosphate synthase, partial [Deltaproteobacteria bacterium]|nr:trehalose-6-phosphate synthase [Deltaproteobacteria bacterium]